MKRKLAALLCACMFVTSVSLPVNAQESVSGSDAVVIEQVAEEPVQQVEETVVSEAAVNEPEVVTATPEASVEVPEVVGESAGFTYEASGIYATITGYTGSDTELVIPEKIDNYTVEKIGYEAFFKNGTITGVVMPDSVKVIEESAFEGCYNLESVKLSKKLETMEEYAFYDCDSLTSIEIPKSLTTAIRDYRDYGVFCECNNLKTVTFEEGTKKIVNGLFAYCPGIVEITIPDTVTAIEDYAFFNCTNLQEVILGEKVATIGYSAFEDCTALTTMVMNEAVKTIDKYAFFECNRMGNVTLPSTLEFVGERAFFNCDGMTSINIPKKLATAERNYENYGVFGECDNLTEVTFEEGIKKIVDGLFSRCPGIADVTIPDTVTAIEDYAFYNCVNLTEVVFGAEIKTIGAYAFEDCTNLKAAELGTEVDSIGNHAFCSCGRMETVTLPKGLQTIGELAFQDCDSLESIFIPKSLTEADPNYESHSVFYGSDNLTEVTFEEGITTIVKGLFGHMTSLEEIVIPDTVTSIADIAFIGCSNLETVTFGTGLKSIGSEAFQDCTSLEAVELKDKVTSIGYDAFENCSSMENLILPKSLETIGEYAFNYCTSLESVEIPKSLTAAKANYEGHSVFYGCNNLTEVTFEEGVTTIVAGLFGYMTSLEEIVIPDTVKTIEERAFMGCNNLENVTFGANIETIKYEAFKDCRSLEAADMKDKVKTIENSVFYECNNLESLTLSKALETIGEMAFYNCDNLSSVEIPKSLKSAATNYQGKGVFYECDNLTDFTFEEGIERIPSGLFASCSTLEEIVIPDTVTVIGERAFYKCNNLTSVELSEDLLSIGYDAFKECVKLENVTFPKKLDTIGDSAFNNCDAITTVELPYSVGTLGRYVFGNCDILERVVLGSGLTGISDYAFDDCAALTEITIPRSITRVGYSAFEAPANLRIHGVKGSYAETYAESVKATFIPYSVPATAISLTETKITMDQGTFTNPGLIVTPEDFTDVVTWKSSNEKVVTVAANGKVTAVNGGKATITVTVGSKTATCEVTVVQPVTKLALEEQTLAMEERATYTLTPLYTPANATNKKLTWKSSDEAVATVDANGKITAKAVGTATITATTTDGSNLSASCELTVHEWNVFCDVAINSWMYPYAKFAFERGLITGKGTNEEGRTIFDPNTAMTRAEFVQVLYSKEGKPAVEYKATFTDVKDKDWFDSAVIWASENGIVSGSVKDNVATFDPYGKITREQMAAIFYKYAVYKGYDVSGRKELTGFEDTAKVSSWALNSLQWALEEGIMTGAGTKLNPLESATRAQAATMMKSFMVAYEGVEK